MRKRLALLIASLFLVFGAVWAQAPVATPTEAITGLLNRIGGDGAASKFEVVIDANLAENGKDVFVITSQNGKPCIKGNTQLSVATGINWYLNHYAHINLTWNNLTTDLSQVTLPVPGAEEKHVCNTTYRYNFNTCTFSYSMAFWTWERWQQEIDWMALHGINAPLNLVGLEVVTRNFLEELGVSEADIDNYIAGPGFMAWFAMNNLEGWGSTINAADVTMNGNPDWWYERQEQLCRKMMQRMRELGMQPVIPGFSGQVPYALNNYTTINIDGFNNSHIVNAGSWGGGFTHPGVVNPSTESYKNMADIYYKHLHDVMGISEFYSIDPFHEMSAPLGPKDLYPGIMEHLDRCYALESNDDRAKFNAPAQPKWIIQQWQGTPVSGAFSAMSSYGDRFIGLDLFSDAPGKAQWNSDYYQSRPYIFCMLHNFGGRSGMHGRLESTMTDYFRALAKGNNCQGIGATPEGSETNPILYDMLFELPWMDPNNRPTADEWLAQYAHARYGVDNATAPKALEALKNLKKSVWACPTDQQGTSEAVILARPKWTVNSVSSWSTSAIYWDTQDVLQAADELSAIKDIVTEKGGQDGIANYDYDFIDVIRQSMVDYAAQLLPLIKAAHDKGDNTEYTRLYQLYLQLMLDLDTMLSYDAGFKLERWTSLARNIAGEVSGTTTNDRNWLEWNARTQVTVWAGKQDALNDYSNRCWSGLIKDFHYERWKYFFENNGGAPNGGWYSGFERPWTVNFTDYDYSENNIPDGMTATEKAAQTFAKYFGRVKGATKNYIFPMGVTTNATKSGVIPEVYRGKTVELPLIIGKNVTITSAWVDLNNDGAPSNNENLEVTEGSKVTIPADATIGKTTAQVVYSDGTDITFSLALIEDITDARTVTAGAGANGSVAIEGTNELSITNTEAVKMMATANTGYNFKDWTDANGNVVSNDNPFIYYGKEAATFTANFIENKWGVVACAPDKDNKGNVKDEAAVMGDIKNNKQFIHNLTLSYYNREAESIFETNDAPKSIFTTLPQIVNIPQGASFTVEYDKGITNNFQHCYFRAYIDLNVDGDFDDEGELLKEVGTRGAQNTAVCSNKINVLLPYDMPLGITHMRLRFDSAWNIGDNAKSQSVRPVYELIINVTEFSEKASTINVETNNENWGTVKVWTDETPADITATEWNVTKGVPFSIAAIKTSDDVEFLGWYDQYGRLLTTELQYSMLAREDATYTAKFRKVLEIDGWEFEYRTEPGVVILTRVRQSGDHDLEIPETVEILGEQCKIVGFDNGVFNNNKDLWSITMPKSMEFVSSNVVFETSLNGNITPSTGGDALDSSKSQLIDLGDYALDKNKVWTLNVSFKTEGKNSLYNQWGTILLSGGNNASNNQWFYLSANGNGYLRLPGFGTLYNDQYDDQNFFYEHTNGKIATFTVSIANQGNGTAIVTVINSEGVSKSSSAVAFDAKGFTQLSSYITKGVNITKLEIRPIPNPFSGCSHLGTIAFSETCDNYYVDSNGDLYNSSKVLICSPEGKTLAQDIRNLGTLIDNTQALMDVIATSVDPIGKATEITLSATEGNYYYIWCNNPHVGGNDGAGGVAALLDEDANTYLHTNWDANTKSESHDYLQINNVNPEDLYNFKIAGQQRSGASDDYPKNIEISGSKNGTDWTYITTVTGLPNTSGATWSSGVLTSNSKYTYYKFVVKTHNNYNGTAPLDRPYFHMAKFDLFKLTSVVEVVEEYQELVGITNDEAANVYDNLVNALFVYNNGGTDAELQAAYNALEPLYTALNDKKNKLEYVREINELVPATEELINAIATSVSPVTEIALSTTEGANNNYIWCNAPTANEGVGNLLDNNDGTILHTAWNAGAVSAYQHYLLIKLADGEDLSNFKFRYKARTGNSDQMNFGDIPSGIKVYGSMEQDGVYDELCTISGLTQSSGYDWTSPAITGSPSYRYLRFNVTANSGFWHMAEFDLFKVASDIEVAPGYKNFGDITNEEAEAAYDNMVKAQALCTTGTAAELEAALNALRTSYETLNAKKGKVLNGVYHINYNGAPTFVGYSPALSGLTGASEGYRMFDGTTDNTESDNGKNHKLVQDAAIAAKVAADELFTIVPNSAGTGYTISAQGLYMEAVGKTSEWCVQAFDSNEANAGVYLIEGSDDVFKLKCANPHREEGWGETPYVNDWGPVFGNDRSNKPNLSTFSFTPVTEYTLAVPASGYTTLCLPFNVVLPEGVEAYDINTLEKQELVSGNVLKELAVAGDIVQAGTPMVVKATEGNHTFAITMDSEGAKTSLDGSVLRGNFVKQNLVVNADAKKYVLNEEDVWELLEVGREIPANTCWIEATDIDYDYNIDMTPEFVEIKGWKFRYEYTTNGVKLTDAAVDGNGELVIPAQVTVDGEFKNVDAISPTFLHGNKTLTSIKFPATLTNLGFRVVEPMFGDDKTVYEGEEGDGGVYDGSNEISSVGANRKYLFPIDPSSATGDRFKVDSKSAWRLTLDVTIDAPELNFNNYGSAIVSTNENSLADNYSNGDMQIYMKAGHDSIIVKIDNADDRYTYTLPVLDNEGKETGELVAHSHFVFELEHDGTGGYQVVIYYDDGRAKMYSISAKEGAIVKDFNCLYYSLPKGIRVKVKVDKLISQGLLVGCTNLQKIEVDDNNPTFMACDHGVLYDKNQYYVMRIPEGNPGDLVNGRKHFEIPSKVVKLYAGSFHGVDADIVLHSNPIIGVVEGHEDAVKNAKFFLSLDDIDGTIAVGETGYGGARDFISTNNNTYQSARYKRAPLAPGKMGTIMLPFAPENALDKYDFFKLIGGEEKCLVFSQVAKLEPNTPYLYRLKETPGEMDFEEIEGKTYDVFEASGFTVTTHAKYDPQDEKPGSYRALGALVNFYIDTNTNKTENSIYYYLSATSGKFHRVTERLNYRPYRAYFVVTPENPNQVAAAPARLSLRLLDGTTTDIDASLVEGMETPVYYDLSGRRVLNPGSGVYIVNGKKVFIK